MFDIRDSIYAMSAYKKTHEPPAAGPFNRLMPGVHHRLDGGRYGPLRLGLDEVGGGLTFLGQRTEKQPPGGLGVGFFQSGNFSSDCHCCIANIDSV